MNLTGLKNKWLKNRNFICPICGKVCTLKTTDTYKRYTCPSCGYKEQRNKDSTYTVRF